MTRAWHKLDGDLRAKADVRAERVCQRMRGGTSPYLHRKISAALGTKDRGLVRQEMEKTRRSLGKD